MSILAGPGEAESGDPPAIEEEPCRTPESQPNLKLSRWEVGPARGPHNEALRAIDPHARLVVSDRKADERELLAAERFRQLAPPIRQEPGCTPPINS